MSDNENGVQVIVRKNIQFLVFIFIVSPHQPNLEFNDRNSIPKTEKKNILLQPLIGE